MQKPEILSVGTPHAGFVLEHFSASKASTPPCQHSLCIFRMNESSPAPALQIFFSDAEVFKPALIEKTETAVRARTVQKRRSSINHAPQ